MSRRPKLLLLSASIIALPSLVVAQEDAAPTSSIMARAVSDVVETPVVVGERHVMRSASMFAIEPEKPRVFRRHDLVQIIVRETSKAKSKHELETEKEYGLDADISAWPKITLEELLNLQMFAGRTNDLPAARLDAEKEFTGEGEFKREDDFTARLTAEVVEILPNDNLVLEARTYMDMDGERSTILVTGVCRSVDVSAANTVLSNQVHDLHVEKVTEGELRKSGEKGVLAKILDTLFAF